MENRTAKVLIWPVTQIVFDAENPNPLRILEKGAKERAQDPAMEKAKGFAMIKRSSLI